MRKVTNGHERPAKLVDVFVIGGGVNGVAIARDAAGRGLSVSLAEKGDFASETSSKSTKLFHGGLRYLEYLEFSLVRHALKEREILLSNMPHISWPMRFVLPIDPRMRFDDTSTVGLWTKRLMPWLKGRRPRFMIRSGLFLYDHIGGRKILPPTSELNLNEATEGRPLRPEFDFAYEYSDCWVDDARLVALMARDAKERGANMMPHTKVISLKRGKNMWLIGDNRGRVFQARALVNAAGPWVEKIAHSVPGFVPQAHVKLVRGSHIILPRLYDHDKAYFFLGRDGRIIFAIPYEQEFTLIGTTEGDHGDPSVPPVCTAEERDYLLHHASAYFDEPLRSDHIVWTYAGVRPLYDDGVKSATAATREYVLTLNEDAAPILSVFGGKITTHRILAEDALDKLRKRFPRMGKPWTKNAPLAGGDFHPERTQVLLDQMYEDYSFMNQFTVRRLFRAYGLEAYDMIGHAKDWGDLGQSFGHGLSQREVDHLIQHEFARSAEDVLWRRGKLGLHLSDAQVKRLDNYVQQNWKKVLS